MNKSSSFIKFDPVLSKLIKSQGVNLAVFIELGPKIYKNLRGKSSSFSLFLNSYMRKEKILFFCPGQICLLGSDSVLKISRKAGLWTWHLLCEGNRSQLHFCERWTPRLCSLDIYCRPKVVSQKQIFVSNLPFSEHKIFMKSWKMGKTKKKLFKKIK